MKNKLSESWVYPRCKVLSVYDGDSITVSVDQGFGSGRWEEKIRLWGVDTPEVKGPQKERGLSVRDVVRGWMPDGCIVGIETIRLAKRDWRIREKKGRYGRILAIVYSDGVCINSRLLQDGLAEIEAYSAKMRAEVIERLL